MTEPTPQHRFRVLDGWRGVCALLVALFHLQINSHVAPLAVVRNAWLFVDFFFVLSGFVITYAYGDKLSSASQIKTFTIRRFARLWPLHVALLAAFVALELYRFAVTGVGFVGERSALSILTNLALIQSLGIHGTLTWNTPAWSISTEFYAYLVFACVCLTTALANIRAALSVLIVAVSVAILLIFSDYGMRETYGWGFFRCLYGFFIGSLTFEFWKRGWLARYAGSIAEIGVIVEAWLFLTFAAGYHALDYLAPFLFACLVWVFAQERGIVSRMMATPSVNAIGRWSYSIYMVHMFVIALIFSALDTIGGWTEKLLDGSEAIRLGNGFAADVLTLFYLTVVVAVAALTWRVIETPGQRFFRERKSIGEPVVLTR